MGRPLLSVVAAMAACVALTATASGQDTTSSGDAVELRADLSQRGRISLSVTGAPGASVTLSELVGDATEPIGTFPVRDGRATAPRVLEWRCDRRSRRFLATAQRQDGELVFDSATVRTPSCAQRFTLNLRPRTGVVSGRQVSARVRDTWRGRSTAAQLCVQISRASSCRAFNVPGTRAGVVVRRSVQGRGGAQLILRAAGVRLVRRFEIRGRRSPLRVLATGDSMIQIVDHHLARGLEPGGRARVVSDARISTGITKSAMFDWVRHAGRQARAHRSHVTIVSLGANDGFALGGVACCADAWVQRYAARARRMMDSYRRRGAGRVYWTTLPAPRDPDFARIYRAVNEAVRIAASTFEPDEVSIIDLAAIFTPGGRFRQSIGGRSVRQADGIHLSGAGAALAAKAIIRRLRADGLVG